MIMASLFRASCAHVEDFKSMELSSVDGSQG